MAEKPEAAATDGEISDLLASARALPCGGRARKTDSNKLEEGYEVTADLKKTVEGVGVSVPKFFQYDGASIPAAAWNIVGTPFNPRFMVASVFHDWLYHTHMVARKTADKLYHAILIEDGVGETRAWLMREAVENFGKPYWANDSDDDSYIARLTKKIAADGRNPADYGLPPKP